MGLGYTFLALGVIVLLVGAVLAGVSFEASGEGQDCENDGFLGDGDCEQGEGSVSFQGAGGFAMIPGLILVLVAAPLLVFGHKARAEEERSQQEQGQGGEGEG